ncbi:MAG: hypothetical protein EOP51_01380 [Sphingobacteriales bacterium]|nr:MAG: hypothetical protein EOP51_01380 [Sphingobacteriales bacterium]
MRCLLGILLLLQCSLIGAAQPPAERPLAISVGGGQYTGYSEQWFGSRFEMRRYPYVQVLDTAFYKQRGIRKVEVLSANRDSTVWWSATFDKATGAVVEEAQLTGNYFLTVHNSKDSLQHTDTTVKAWYQASKLMRLDTVITTRYYYRQGDTNMSLMTTRSTSYYNGALIDEQNEYYNKTFLHRHISDFTLGRTSTNEGGKVAKHVYLRRAFRTNYDSNRLYLARRDEHVEAFRATVDSGKSYIPIMQLNKQHPFVRRFYDKPNTRCYTSGACFNEPRFYYESRACGTHIDEMQRERRETEYGLTTDRNGLYRDFYSERVERWPEGRQSGSDRNVLYVFRYSYF